MIALDGITDDQKDNLTFQLTQVMEQWKLADQDQVALLGLTESIKARHCIYTEEVISLLILIRLLLIVAK